MTGFTVNVTCPRCGGPVDFVAHGVPAGSESRAVVRCPPCGRDFVVCIVLLDAVNRAEAVA